MVQYSCIASSCVYFGVTSSCTFSVVSSYNLQILICSYSHKTNCISGPFVWPLNSNMDMCALGAGSLQVLKLQILPTKPYQPPYEPLILYQQYNTTDNLALEHCQHMLTGIPCGINNKHASKCFANAMHGKPHALVPDNLSFHFPTHRHVRWGERGPSHIPQPLIIDGSYYII